MHAQTLAATALFALGCATGLACAGSSHPDTDTPVVASGEGFTITLGQLDEEVRERLYQDNTSGGQPSLVYQLRSSALDAMIQNLVLATQSESHDMSVEEFVLSQTPAVTDAEIEAFYKENEQRLGQFEDVADRIRGYLEQQKANETVAALVAAADIRVDLEPPRVAIDPIGPSRGPDDAAVTIVEFSDFQCPFCTRAVPIIDALLERYPNDIRVVYRHLPLESIHPRARPAAIASACADAQDKFWPFHDGLFANPGSFGDEDFARIATDADLDAEAFQTCYSGRATEATVDADMAAAQAAGVTSTPAFLVNGILLKGAQPVENFEKVIARELELGRTATP